MNDDCLKQGCHLWVEAASTDKPFTCMLESAILVQRAAKREEKGETKEMSIAAFSYAKMVSTQTSRFALLCSLVASDKCLENDQHGSHSLQDAMKNAFRLVI